MRLLNKHTASEEEKRNSVYIGRSQGLYHMGNPFSHLKETKGVTSSKNRWESVLQFAQWLEGHFPSIEPKRRKWVLEQMERLQTRKKLVLLCYCTPNLCHGDVYIWLMKGMSYADVYQLLEEKKPVEKQMSLF